MSVAKSGDVFKDTVSTNVVVERYAELCSDGKIVTYHDYANEPNNTRIWYLDSRCELSPKLDTDITTPVSRIVRPRGTWTITSKFLGEGARMDLYQFTIYWPSSWATKGYTSFTFGLKTEEEAREWHRALADALAGLKAGPTYPVAQPSGLAQNLNTTSVPTLAPSRASTLDEAADNVLQAQSVPSRQPPTDSPLRPTAAATAAPEAAATTPSAPAQSAFAASCTSPWLAPGCSSAGEGPTDTGKQWRTLTERWVPYKQVNGVAIYHLEDPASSIPGLGGEFMVSTTIRGPPSAVLGSLMCESSHTTILGPASEVEVLQNSKGKRDKKGAGSEELRVVLEAPGWAGRLCAPREMVVQRMLKTEGGMHVVLFSSVESQPRPAERKLRSLYRRPVTGWARGNYIIAPLNGHRLDTSPETMITCIIKVDLRGVCGDNSWLRPFADALGWTDAFLDRILMTVILVRDEVEHSRFVLDWQQVLSEREAGDGPAAADEGEEDGPAATSQGSGGARTLGRMQSTFQRAGSARFRRAASKLGPGMESITGAAAAAVASADGAVVAQAVPEDEVLPPEAVLVDLDSIKSKASLECKYWETIHAPDAKAAPFKVRGPTYLKDKKKIAAGDSVFTLAAVDLVALPHAVDHIARYLPSIRKSGAPFAIIVNLIIPGNPMLALVATFITERHPNDALGPKAPANPMSEPHDWEPFDFVLHKFLNSDEATRNTMFKLIPHIANGSWVIRQSVGSTPVIIGKALKTTYHQTSQYLEIDIDVSANSTAAYVTGMVRGATTGLVIDLGFVLEGTTPWELPECLLGGFRLNHLDTTKAQPLDMSKEIPLVPALKAPKQGGA